MSAHSTILGGSNAARLMACPASHEELKRVPLSAYVESAYAAEGTMLHEYIAWLIRGGDGDAPCSLNVEQYATIDKAMTMMAKLMKAWGGGFKVLACEEQSPFPGLEGSFGTVDLMLVSKTHVIILDWKFGQGVPVQVLYELEDGDVLNAQPVFYAICARHKHPKQFAGKKVVLAVVQPRLDALSDVVVDDSELDEFQRALTAAYAEAISPNPHMEKGEHCRFALCKATCPLWTGPLLNLPSVTEAALEVSVTDDQAAYGEFLSNSLQLAEYAELWATEIRRQAHAYLEEGGRVPFWKLVPKRATRKWVDEETTPAALTAIGVKPHEYLSTPELMSVAQVEKALTKGKKKIVIPAELYHQTPTGTTIVHSDDARPEATHAMVVGNLRLALEKLN